MDPSKRPNEEETALVPAKRPRQDIVQAEVKGRAIVPGADIYTAKFSPNGNTVASGSQDRKIFLWNTYGECENFAALAGHSNAIMEIQWSADGSVGEPYIVTGSDDCTVKVWDARRRNFVHSINSKFQVTAVSFGGRDDTVISAGLDNAIHVWDLRNLSELCRLDGHADTITCVRLSPDGTQVLTNAMDNTVRIWDVQPYCPTDRMLKVFLGAQHNFEKNLIKCAWSPDGRRISCGSADRNVYVWDTHTGNLVYCLPGHKGSVNEVDFHPKEPIILSAASDRKIYLGELM